MPDLKLVIFDVDGTLVDSQSEIISAMRVAFAQINFEMPSRDDILSSVGLSLPDAFVKLLPDADPAKRQQAVDSYKQGYHDNRVKGARPELYDGIASLLDRLETDPDVLLGLATGKSRRGLDALLGHFGWAKRFVTTQVSDDHPSKPHPSMILSAMADVGVDPCDAVMIGDTSYDIDMAQAAGVHSIGVSWGYHPGQHLQHAAAVVSDTEALYAAIKRMIG